MPRPHATQRQPDLARPRFREPLGRGHACGWAAAQDVREAMAATGTSIDRTKPVLRALEDADIRVTAPAGQR